MVNQILPGAALSILAGNFFYAWQARRLMRRTGRDDVTALPYGINTVSLLAFIFLIMGPVYRETHDAQLTWRVGLFACILSGLIEVAGAFVGDWLRRHTPLAALLTALAGVAITFIAMGFVFQIFASPAIALAPMMLILATYAGRLKLPLGVPGGLVAVLLGVAIAWISRACGTDWFQPAPIDYHFAWRVPIPAFGDAIALLASPRGWRYLAVIFPMSLFNIIGSLQNQHQPPKPAWRLFPKPARRSWPTGSAASWPHSSAAPSPPPSTSATPDGKPWGQRWPIPSSTACGHRVHLPDPSAVGLVLHFVPLEATLGILLWIGIIMTAQAFQEVPKPLHAIAVAFGLIPALASWAAPAIGGNLAKRGKAPPSTTPRQNSGKDCTSTESSH